MHALYGKTMRDEVANLWFEALKGYDLETVSAALSRHAVNPDNGQFMPRPADVVKLIEGGSDEVALAAWSKVDRAVRQIGTWESVVFDDPLIHYAIANMGGWIALGHKGEDEWPFVRNQFVTLYRGARMRSFEFPAKLVGIAEAANSSRNVRQAPPRFVGDRAKALAVLERGTTDNTTHLEARPVAALLPRERSA